MYYKKRVYFLAPGQWAFFFECFTETWQVVRGKFLEDFLAVVQGNHLCLSLG